MVYCNYIMLLHNPCDSMMDSTFPLDDESIDKSDNDNIEYDDFNH